MPVSVGAGLLEGELNDLVAALDESEKEKAKRSIQVCAEILRMFGTSAWRIQDRMKEISDCVEGLTREPQFAPCHVSSVVQNVFDTLSWLADQQGVWLKSEGLDALPEIEADDRRLFNAFYNLINNAVPEVPSGGSVTVSGTKDPTGEGILVSVADTGRGMPPEIRASLFTAHAKSRKAGGTGLGTKIIKDVVDAHRGRITVESEVGVGTRFQIYLPLHPPSVS